ncbi:MAG: hypothetical protein Q9168_004865 [Polycauliona sp. 1 TL-2023]
MRHCLATSKKRSPTVEKWRERKEEILRLYIVEGLALKPVMRAMRAPDFDPTDAAFDPLIREYIQPPYAPLVWSNPPVDFAAATTAIPTAPPTSNQPLTHVQWPWHDPTSNDYTNEGLPEHLPDVWRQGWDERRRVTASGYNSTGQPRVQHSPAERLHHSQYMKNHTPSVEVSHDPLMPQAPLHLPWDTQPLSHGRSTGVPPSMPAMEVAWWDFAQFPNASTAVADAGFLQ